MEKSKQQSLLRSLDFKSRSTSTVILDGTIENPNVKIIVAGVANLLHGDMMGDIEDELTIDPRSAMYFFDEEKYIAEKPEKFNAERIELLRKIPTEEEFSKFIEALYDIAQFSGECCVICLIYIYRIKSLTQIPLLATTWRPLVLISIMIAQKMWDDKYLNNSDFVTLYPFFDNAELNALEMKFLELIQYNTHIKFSLYTKYYLELKGLVPNLPLKQMNVFEMAKLERQSKKMEESLKKKAATSANAKEAGQSTDYVIS